MLLKNHNAYKREDYIEGENIVKSAGHGLIKDLFFIFLKELVKVKNFLSLGLPSRVPAGHVVEGEGIGINRSNESSPGPYREHGRSLWR